MVTQEEADRQAAEAYQRLVDIQQGFKTSMSRGTPSEQSHKLAGAGAEVDTALAPEFLVALNEQLLSWPEGFTVHPKLRKQLERRRAALGPDGGIDWAHAEALALASLLTEGVPVRSPGRIPSGARSASGTSCCTTSTPGAARAAQRLPGALAPFELHNSPLERAGHARASSTATAPRPPRRSCSGRRSSATSSTAPRNNT